MDSLVTMYPSRMSRYTFHSNVEIGGRRFEAILELDNRYGSNQAIDNGRILYFLMMDERLEYLACFEQGRWVIPTSDLDGEAFAAAGYFIWKYNLSDDERKKERSCVKL